MISRTIRIALTMLVAALVLSACGSADPSDEGAATGSGAATEASADVSTAGDTLALGEQALVNYVEYGTSDQKEARLAVSAQRVRRGSIADFKDFNLDAKARRTVPYYVTTSFENRGQAALIRHLLQPSVEDGDGQEYRPTNLIVLSGTFKPCPEYSRAKLAPGERFTGCSVVMLPKGEQLARVRFDGDVTEDPAFWRPA